MSSTAERMRMKERSRELADLLMAERMAKEEAISHWTEGDFPERSQSRPWHIYQMNMTPEGYAVHQGEGCPGEPFNGPLTCKHSKEHSMTSLVPAQAQAVANRQQFSEEDVRVIKNTICRGSTDAELGMFLATCRSTGLNPFMKQIWAIQRNVNVGSSQSPKYEKQMQIQVGIDGYRVVRDRLVDANGNPYFDGMEGPQWSKDGREWLDYWADPKPPMLARVAIYRKGISRPFVAQARWDAYNQKNAMWNTMGAEQLAKCAEALALRRAFPADMGALPAGSINDMEVPELADVPAPIANLIQGHEPILDAEFTETPGSASAGTAGGGETSQEPPAIAKTSPAPTCSHPVDSQFYDDADVLHCSACNRALEGPDSVQAPGLPI